MASLKSVKNNLKKNTIGSMLILLLVVFVGGYLLNMLMGGGLLNRRMENFENGTKLVYFYMDGCPACNQFSPVWNEFKSKYSGPLTLEKLEQNVAADDLEKHNIKGFPTVLLISPNGTKLKEFTGERTVANLNAFTNDSN